MQGRRLAAVSGIACAMLLIAMSAAAQITTGKVIGTVKDQQGGVIPGATVTLISETKGTRLTPVVTSETGDFQFPVAPVDTYTVEITMPSFKTMKQTGIAVSPGVVANLGSLTIQLGGTTETVEVRAEVPVIQTTSGERSFVVPTISVQNLPFQNRGFQSVASLAPGVTLNSSGNSPTAQGTQSCMSTNVSMDGVSTMDTGSSGSAIFNMNNESIQEVKVIESGYQAEYGLRSGLQVMAVTKSGTNMFHGSLYNIRRNSRWDSNSHANILNNVAKTRSKSQDIGFSIGGPVGKPGGHNKVFFFFAEEFNPATAGGVQRTYRLPTALERQGDFSQTTDNNGNLYPYIKDPLSSAACSASNTAGCFKADGVLGRIPQNRLYSIGLSLLNLYPMPNNQSATIGTNHQFIQPTYDTLLYQPALRVDYQLSERLRASFKYQGNNNAKRVSIGTLPGWNDSITPIPHKGTEAVTVNYSINPLTFLEATYGRAGNQLAGCGGLPVNDVADSRTTGLADFPLIFPDANILNHDYYAYEILQYQNPPYWDGNRIWKVPAFSWGNRITSAPPNVVYPGFININTTQDVAVNLTMVRGAHTFKAGFYNNHSLKRENNVLGGTNFGTVSFAQDTVGVNPYDTSFGFSNAAIGSFSSFVQASAYVEGTFTYDNREAYVQDSWRVNPKWSIDYGVRFVHATSQHDNVKIPCVDGNGTCTQEGNFLPDQWSQSAAPVLYVPGCANNAATCSGSNRSAKDPLTGQILGPNTSLATGTLVPDSGQVRNGLFQAGNGISDLTYLFPKLNVGPRFGTAYDVSGNQHLVLRGSLGLYFDRPRGGNAQALVGNTYVSSLQTLRYSQLQSLSGLSTQSPAQLTAYQYHAALPTSVEWNTGVQMMLPWDTALDVAYVGHHNYNAELTGQVNAIDIGTAFDPAKQDPTTTPSATPGASSLAALYPDLVRAYTGYTGIAFRAYNGWRKYDAIQISVNRRLRGGVSFGFNDAITIRDIAKIAPRYDHGADGQPVLRADQGQAQALMQDQLQPRHLMKATAVWQLPGLENKTGSMRVASWILNDWQLSSVWTGSTGTPYSVSYSYQNGGSSVNLTGSPDFPARIRILGDTGAGCSSNQYAQFNAAGFGGPLTNSDGLESSNNYLTGCFQSVLDLSLARNIRLGGGRSIQLRIDAFNLPNQAIITNRSTSMTLNSPNTPTTIVNNQYNTDGSLNQARLTPQNAGFGAATAWQNPRTLQAYIRFSF